MSGRREPTYGVNYKGQTIPQHVPYFSQPVFNAAIQVEAIEENRVTNQIAHVTSGGGRSVIMPSGSVSKQSPAFPSGGRFDALLATPGKATELCKRLASIFKDDPPVDCGKTGGATAGLSCVYHERYPSQVFSPKAVIDLLKLSRSFWDSGPKGNVTNLTVTPGCRLIIVGDTHGQLEDVLWLFFKHGVPSETNQYLFNGDIVDRGGHALEILLCLMAFKRDCHSSVHINRGNHEDPQCVVQFGFASELTGKFQRFGGEVLAACNALFPVLPLLTIVAGEAQLCRFCVAHGGVPVDIPGFRGPVHIENHLMRMERKRVGTEFHPQDIDGQILFNLLWSDPAMTLEQKQADNPLGRGNKFIETETRAFCQINNLSFFVRSHEVPRTLRGVEAFHSNMCYTVFSASNYSGSIGNYGGVIVCECQQSGSIGNFLEMSEHMAPEWPTLDAMFEAHRETLWGSAKCKEVAASWEQRFGIGVAEDDEPAPETKENAQAKLDALAQLKQFAIERIVEFKEQLFDRFNATDKANTGRLPKSVWAANFLEELKAEGIQDAIPMELLLQLAEEWGLKGNNVEYARFLHRFQIQIQDGKKGSSRVDNLKRVSAIRRALLDVSAVDIERLLDPNRDATVSCPEFTAFMPLFKVDIPAWQAAALYETFAEIVKENPLTLDSTILCLALMSRDPQAAAEAQWSNFADGVGQEITRMGHTLVGMFRSWDTDNNGFLSLSELEAGLEGITREQAHDFMDYLDHDATGRVSILEFVRAVAPREMCVNLQKSVMKEVLQLVWLCRPALITLLGQQDPLCTGKVNAAAFRQCLLAVNRQLEQMGRKHLSAIQLGAIGEIASGGKDQVEYRPFMEGLFVVDCNDFGL